MVHYSSRFLQKSSNFAPDEECPYIVSNKVVSNIILTNNFITFCFISLHFICKELYKKIWPSKQRNWISMSVTGYELRLLSPLREVTNHTLCLNIKKRRHWLRKNEILVLHNFQQWQTNALIISVFNNWWRGLRVTRAESDRYIGSLFGFTSVHLFTWELNALFTWY